MHEKLLFFHKYTPLDTDGTIFTKIAQDPTLIENSPKTTGWTHVT
jgi:hypothetical protein